MHTTQDSSERSRNSRSRWSGGASGKSSSTRWIAVGTFKAACRMLAVSIARTNELEKMSVGCTPSHLRPAATWVTRLAPRSVNGRSASVPSHSSRSTAMPCLSNMQSIPVASFCPAVQQRQALKSGKNACHNACLQLGTKRREGITFQVSIHRRRQATPPGPRGLPCSLGRRTALSEHLLHFLFEKSDVHLLILQNGLKVGLHLNQQLRELQSQHLVAEQLDDQRPPLARHARKSLTDVRLHAEPGFELF